MTATRTVVDMNEIGETLPRLLRDARPGDEIILERNNIAVARVVPVTPDINAMPTGENGPMNASKRRAPRFGTAAGKVIMRDDFDGPLEEFAGNTIHTAVAPSPPAPDHKAPVTKVVNATPTVNGSTMTTEEAMAFLRVTDRTLRAYRKAGRLTAYKVEGFRRVLYLRKEIKAILKPVAVDTDSN